MKANILIVAAMVAGSALAALTPAQLEKLQHSLIHRGDGKGRPDNTMEALLYKIGRAHV